MNDVLNQLYNRKSVRDYLEKPVEEEKAEQILKAAMRAPTAGNMMLYSILRIEDPSLKNTLAVTCDNQPFIAKAPLVLLFLADYRRFYRRYLQLHELGGQKPRALTAGDFMLASADAVIAAQSAVVAADSLGIGSCYIGDVIEHFEQHRALLHLAPFTAPVAMVCFGYPTKEQAERSLTPRFPGKYIVSVDRYQDLSPEELVDFCPDLRAASLLERKFNTAFGAEMGRSADEILKNFVSPAENEKNTLPKKER